MAAGGEVRQTLRQDEAGEIDVLRRAFAAQVALTVGRGERIAPDHPLQSQFEQLASARPGEPLQRLAVDVRGTPRHSSAARSGKLWPFSRLTLPLADAEDPAVARPAVIAPPAGCRRSDYGSRRDSDGT